MGIIEKKKLAEDKISEIRTQLKAANDDFAAKRKAFGDSEADPTDPATPEFKALDESGQKKDQLATALETATKAYGVLVGVDPADPDGDAKAQELLIERKPGAGMETYGKRLEDSDEFKTLIDSGVFKSKAAFGTRQLIEELASREETKDLIGMGNPDVGLGNLIDPQRGPLIPQNLRPIKITNLIAKGLTDSTSIKFPVETVVSQDAAFVKDPTTEMPVGSGDPEVTAVQAGVKPKTTLAFDIRTFEVETLPVWLPVHRNSMEDIPFLRSFIDARLGNQLDQKIEDEIIAGDGTGENFTGILETDGIGLVNPADGIAFLEGIHHGITLVRLAFEEPQAVGIHPLDWEKIRLLREMVIAQTEDPEDPQTLVPTGQYMFGPPSQAGTTTVWGLTPIITTAIPEGTALVGDYSQAMLWLRAGMRISASDSHEDYFTRNLVAILAEMRAAFGVLKPPAFAKVEIDG